MRPHIDGHERVPALLVEIRDLAGMLQPGVVAEHIEPAQPLGAVVDQRLDAVLAGDVAMDEMDGGAELLGGRGRVLLVDVADDDLGTLRDELLDRFLADARGGTGDDDPLTLETLAHDSLPFLLIRSRPLPPGKRRGRHS
jgi:hypothetical protein